MREIGGYIELDAYAGKEYHTNAIDLNCGRSCLAYLIKARGIKKILLPYFLCDSVTDVCMQYGVKIKYYHINDSFMPVRLNLQSDEWLYVVNFYGQLEQKQILDIVSNYKKVIFDQAQAFFEKPIQEIDTLYTCRKFFGVPDGAYLYTNAKLEDELESDESFERMHFLLGRYERTASEFYSEYIENNKVFKKQPIKKMSKLTHNLLCGIDYQKIISKRDENYNYLNLKLGHINKLRLKKIKGAFMYPLYVENGEYIRKQLQKQKIYIPMLWPFVFNICSEDMLEYDMAKNILPVPIDQRYDIEDMERICTEILKNVSKE